MEYTVRQLAEIAGISSRTLRYYDEIGLLKPARMNSSGYRIYGQREVDRLQQILFYRERFHLEQQCLFEHLYKKFIKSGNKTGDFGLTCIFFLSGYQLDFCERKILDDCPEISRMILFNRCSFDE